MTETRNDPRYIRIVGLALLAALLVVASCQVEQLSINIEVEQVTPAGAEEPLPTSAESEGIVLNGVRMVVDGDIVLTGEQLLIPLVEEFEVWVDPVVIHEVSVQGNRRQARLAIIAMGGLNPGSAYTLSDVRRATALMWATGQFKDIRVRVEGALGDDMVTLVWEVVEQDLEEPPPSTASGASAQIIPSPQEINRLIREDPEQVRQLIRESGLSEAEIRAQLAAAGYPANTLDAFFSAWPIDAATAPSAAQGRQEILRVSGQAVSEEEIPNRLAESGLTRADVRSQLASMGLDPAIADPYFDRLEEEPAENQAELQALRAASQRAAEALAEARAQAVLQELRPEDRAAIQAGPVSTPMTVRPDILNRNEIVSALRRGYPRPLRDAGTGGTVDVWFYLSETGQVLHTRVNESSGYPEMDAAALRIGAVFRFSAAIYQGEPVQVWIRLPITFEVQN